MVALWKDPNGENVFVHQPDEIHHAQEAENAEYLKTAVVEILQKILLLLLHSPLTIRSVLFDVVNNVLTLICTK